MPAGLMLESRKTSAASRCSSAVLSRSSSGVELRDLAGDLRALGDQPGDDMRHCHAAMLEAAGLAAT